MIKQKIKENSLVYIPRHQYNDNTLYHVTKSNKEDYPFCVSTSEGNYSFNEDGISASGNRVVFLATPENKKLLEDLFFTKFEDYEDSRYYRKLKETFSILIDSFENLSEYSFNKELAEHLQGIYTKYFEESEDFKEFKKESFDSETIKFLEEKIIKKLLKENPFGELK